MVVDGSDGSGHIVREPSGTLATAPHVTALGSEDTEWLEWVSDPKPWPPDLELAAATKCEVKAATSNCLSQVHIWDSSWENLSPSHRPQNSINVIFLQ